jgi:hypothetical protein
MILLCNNLSAQTQDVFPTWKWVIEPQYDVAWSFYEGLAAVRKDGKWGFINKTGEFVIEPQFDGVRNFSNGMAAIKQKGKWGYINSAGEIAIEPIYYDAYNFKNEIARAERFAKDEDFFINKNGKLTPVTPNEKRKYNAKVKTPTNRSVFQSAKNGKYGFVDKNNNWVIVPQFIGVKEFSDSVACVNLNGKWGFITLLTPFQYVKEYIKTKLNETRTSDIGAELIILFDKAIENLIESTLYSMEIARADIGDYDEDHKTYLISIPTYGNMVINIDNKEKSRLLKSNWAHIKFIEPVFTIARTIQTGEPEIILTGIKIINPANEDTVSWSTHERYEHKDLYQAPEFEYITLRDAFRDVLYQNNYPVINDSKPSEIPNDNGKSIENTDNKEETTENNESENVDNNEPIKESDNKEQIDSENNESIENIDKLESAESADNNEEIEDTDNNVPGNSK